MQSRNRMLSVIAVLTLVAAAPAWSGGHAWDVSEAYSDSTGTIQFIELWEYTNNGLEKAVQGHVVASLTKSFTIPPPALAGGNHFLLLGTAAFAALPGAPAVNYIIPSGSSFFSLAGADSLSYSGTPAAYFLQWSAGQLPLNGIDSWNNPLTNPPGPEFAAAATPTNYANATFAPPGTNGLKVGKVPGFPDGSRLTINWNSGVCLGSAKNQIAYGFGSQLPTALGGIYGLQPTGAGQCAIVSASPKTWSGVVDPGPDSKHFLWFTLLATNGAATEGSWGKDSAGGERKGPGAGGMSGQCSMTSKVLANTCQ